MAVSIQEVPLGLGLWSAPLKTADRELLDKLADGNFIVIFEGETAVHILLILDRDPSEASPSVGGLGADWVLGGQADGPAIDYRDYVAGNNKLSNPDFLLGDERYRLSSETGWVIDEDAGTAAVVTASLADDILESDETFEAHEGEQYETYIGRTAAGEGPGELRPQVIFEGRFNHPNVLLDPGLTGELWFDHSEFPDDTAVADGEITLGPCTRKQLLFDPKFDQGGDGLDGWNQSEGVWTVVATGIVGVTPAGSRVALSQAASLDEPKLGDRYLVAGYVLPPSVVGGNDGEGFIQVNEVHDLTNVRSLQTQRIAVGETASTQFNYLHEELEITDETTNVISVFLFVENCTTGTWQFGQPVTLTRLVGNLCERESNGFTVTPSRTYKAQFQIVSDASCVDGFVSVITQFGGPGRDVIVAEVATVTLTNGLVQALTFEVNPPSGYDNCAIRFVGHDIVGGSFRIFGTPDGEAHVFDADPDTLLVDQHGGDFIQATAPKGTEHVRSAVAAESAAAGFAINDLELSRIGVDVDVTGDIVRELLTDIRSGRQLLAEGDIDGADEILFDRRVRNQHNRDVLRQLSQTGWASPRREFRVRPGADPTYLPTLDWGTPEAIYEDRTDMILVDSELVVIAPPRMAESARERVTVIRVIGADRKTVAGDLVPIVAEAPVINPRPMLSAFGQVLERVRTIQDSTLNHPDLVRGYAQWQAERAAAIADQSVRVTISGWRGLGRIFHAGDWVYPYQKDVVEDPANPVPRAGQTIFPKRSRVMSANWKLGDGDYRAVLVRPGHDPLDITDAIVWDGPTSAELELGKILPDFAVDPDGGSAMKQFQIFRGASPR